MTDNGCRSGLFTARKRSCGKVMFSQVSVFPQREWVFTPRGWVCPGGGYSAPPPIHATGILRDTVDKRVVRILLECFLVL